MFKRKKLIAVLALLVLLILLLPRPSEFQKLLTEKAGEIANNPAPFLSWLLW